MPDNGGDNKANNISLYLSNYPKAKAEAGQCCQGAVSKIRNLRTLNP